MGVGSLSPRVGLGFIPCPTPLPRQGKGLFATKNICKGETVFVERPVVSSQFLWNALYNYRGEQMVVAVVVARPIPVTTR